MKIIHMKIMSEKLENLRSQTRMPERTCYLVEQHKNFTKKKKN